MLIQTQEWKASETYSTLASAASIRWALVFLGVLATSTCGGCLSNAWCTALISVVFTHSSIIALASASPRTSSSLSSWKANFEDLQKKKSKETNGRKSIQTLLCLLLLAMPHARWPERHLQPLRAPNFGARISEARSGALLFNTSEHPMPLRSVKDERGKRRYLHSLYKSLRRFQFAGTPWSTTHPQTQRTIWTTTALWSASPPFVSSLPWPLS